MKYMTKIEICTSNEQELECLIKIMNEYQSVYGWYVDSAYQYPSGLRVNEIAVRDAICAFSLGILYQRELNKIKTEKP